VTVMSASSGSGDRDVGVERVGKRPQWAGLVQGPVRTVLIEIGLVLGEDLAQVCGVHDEDPVEDRGVRRQP
jgi:hypothetical protein